MSDKSVIILCVSREILEGAVVDRNAAFMAGRINELGFRIRTIQVVDRVEAEMVQALKWAAEQSPSFILMTGAMGPNFDDNARACAAKAFGLSLQKDAKALDYVRQAYQRMHARGGVDDDTVTEERARMALLPAGAISYENFIGTAPAVQFKAGKTTVFLLPGVPAEMQRLFTSHVLGAMMAEAPSTLRKQRHIDFDGGDESVVGRILATIQKKHPGVTMRTRMLGQEASPVIQITLQAEGHDPLGLEDVLERAELDLRSRIGMESGI